MTDPKFGKYKIIVCGGSFFKDYELLKKTLDKYLERLMEYPIEIVSGTAKGADQLAEQYAMEELNATLGDGLRRFPPLWHIHGKAAGPIRNSEMASYATHCVAFYNGRSKGTLDMINKAKAAGLEVMVISV